MLPVEQAVSMKQLSCIRCVVAFLRSFMRDFFFPFADVEVAAATEEGLGCCGNVMALISFIVIIIFFPFSLLVSIKVSFDRTR